MEKELNSELNSLGSRISSSWSRHFHRLTLLRRRLMMWARSLRWLCDRLIESATCQHVEVNYRKIWFRCKCESHIWLMLERRTRRFTWDGRRARLLLSSTFRTLILELARWHREGMILRRLIISQSMMLHHVVAVKWKTCRIRLSLSIAVVVNRQVGVANGRIFTRRTWTCWIDVEDFLVRTMRLGSTLALLHILQHWYGENVGESIVFEDGSRKVTADFHVCKKGPKKSLKICNVITRKRKKI